VGGVDCVWCSDITYLPSVRGWLYLAVVLDAFSRRVVGWELGHMLEAELVVRAVERAMETRGELTSEFGTTGLDGSGMRLFHSDRGSQYASRLCGERLASHGWTASMSRQANCWDNAVMESFFGSLKTELVAQLPGQRFDNIQEAYRLLADYIDNFYNTVRMHSTLNYQSPVAFELVHRIKQISAN